MILKSGKNGFIKSMKYEWVHFEKIIKEMEAGRLSVYNDPAEEAGLTCWKGSRFMLRFF